MAADTARAPQVGALLAAALPPAVLVSGLGFLLLLGVRPDLGEALTQLRVMVKQGYPVLLAVAAAGAALRLARPGMRVGRWWLGLAAVPALLAAAILVELAVLPAGDRGRMFFGHSIGICLPAITLMAAPILVASLWALRQGASVHPALSGAVAGLLSGGAATALYAFHCTEDSPLFYAVWYVLPILAMTGAGAVAGSRILRW